MALVIYILLYADQNNYNTCLCQKEIVENWDVSEEELWEELTAVQDMFF